MVPHPELGTEEEQQKKIMEKLGMSKEAFAKFSKFCEDDPITGSVIKGHRYRDGLGVAQDYGIAAKFYAEAARKGNPEGMYNLAKLYDHGMGVKKDYETSIFWLKKAAEMKSVHPLAGIAHSQHSLGLKYAEGVGVKQVPFFVSFLIKDSLLPQNLK